MVSSQSRKTEDLTRLQNPLLEHAEEGKEKFMKALKTPAVMTDRRTSTSCAKAARPFLLLLLLLSAVLPALGSDINACKYLLVSDFTSDPFLIAKELRVQAQSNGFVVISSANDVSGEEKLKGCFMTGSWSRTASGGSVSLRVLDASNE